MVLADLTMSLDNVLAVAAVAERSPQPGLMLIVGLALSVPLVLLGGGVVATLLGSFPWLVWLGAAILTSTAASLIAEDRGLAEHLTGLHAQPVLVAVVLTVIVLGMAWRSTRSARPQG